MGKRNVKPSDCPYCKRVLPSGFHEKKGKLRGEKIRNSLLKAKSEGLHIGRPITVNHERIRELRKQGLSMRKIATIIGCSTYSVHSALVSP